MYNNLNAYINRMVYIYNIIQSTMQNDNIDAKIDCFLSFFMI